MDPFMLLILFISIVGIFVILGISHVKTENHISSQYNAGIQGFGSFMVKIKGNSSKLKR